MSQYIDKLNRYTSGEAAFMYRDGVQFDWRRAVAHFVHDFQSYYDRGEATADLVHGFIYSFHSAFYRFEQHAKLFEHRWRAGQLTDAEIVVPASVEQMLEY